MSADRPDAAAVARLVAYLPRLYSDAFKPVVRWEGGTRDEKGVWSLPWPVYDPLVPEFFGRVASDGWLDHGYSPEAAGRMLAGENQVEQASLDEIRAMLTFCVRGERFSDGHWAEMIERGHIRRLLVRLAELQA